MNKHEALAILGALEAQSFEEVTAAYKKLAIKLHPDSHGATKEAAKNFKRVGSAYRYLQEEQRFGQLELPIQESKVPEIPPEWAQFLNPDMLEPLVDHIVKKTPKLLQPAVRKICKAQDIFSILSFVMKHGIELPKKLKKPTVKVPKNAKRVAYINKIDYNYYSQSSPQIQPNIQLRCCFEMKVKKEVHRTFMPLCFPEGLDPTGELSLEEIRWPIKLVDFDSFFASKDKPKPTKPNKKNLDNHWPTGQIFPE